MGNTRYLLASASGGVYGDCSSVVKQFVLNVPVTLAKLIDNTLTEYKKQVPSAKVGREDMLISCIELGLERFKTMYLPRPLILSPYGD